MFIVGLGTASPPHRYTQAQCWEALQSSRELERLESRSRSLLRKVLHADNGIATRSLCLESLADAFALNPDPLHQRFTANAPALAAVAAARAMEDAGWSAGDVDGLLISTCTGYLCPGLTSYVSERLGLRPDIRALDLVGQGCGAALPNLQTAAALLASRQCERVLTVCVEICSAAFYLDDNPGVLVSACLFGDGAAAAALTLEPGRRRVEWLRGTGILSPNDRDTLRFEQRGGMLRNILNKEVPGLAAKYVGQVFAQTGIARDEVTGWILHPGGRNVLLALSERLALTETDVSWSAGILREQGNLSSPSVLFVLQAALAGNAPGGHWWMSSFGAGFSAFGALLQVD